VTDAIQLAPFDEDSYYQDPLGFFARLRESRPVAPVRMPAYGRAWIVTRYADVRTVLTDPRLAKDVHRWPGGGRSRPSEATGVYAHMLHADPPDHTRLRRLVQKAFTPRRATLRPRAEDIAAGLLDEIAATRGDGTDLLSAYARPSRSRCSASCSASRRRTARGSRSPWPPMTTSEGPCLNRSGISAGDRTVLGYWD
jgi:cytochrome P450